MSNPENELTAEKLRDLRTQTVTGSVWASVGSVGRQFLVLVFSVWLTRLLTPTEFGLLGMVLVVTTFIRTIMMMGMGAAIMREAELTPRYYGTTFTLQLFLGLCFGAILLLAAPLLAWFYGEPQLEPLTRLLSLDLVMAASYTILRARMRRELRFRSIITVELIAVLIGGAAGVVIALQGFGVYSLVAMLLCEQATMTLGFWLVVPERPSFCFDRRDFKQLLAFGSPLTVSNIVRRLVLVSDNMLVGKFFGEQALGLYSRSFTLMLLPVKQISGVLTQVLLPAFSRVQHKHEIFRDGFLRAVALIGMVTFPMMTGMAVTAEHFVLGIFGAQWRELIPVLRIMCWSGAILSVVWPSGIIYTSQGKTKLGMMYGLAINAVLLTGFAIGILSGSLLYFAMIYTCLQLVLHVPQVALAGRLIGLRYTQFMKALSGIILCCMLMGGAVLAIDWLAPDTWPHLAVLFLEVATGAVVYLALLHFGKLAAWREFRELLHDQWQALLARRKGP